MSILLSILALFTTGSFSVTNMTDQVPELNVTVQIAYSDGNVETYSLEEFNETIKEGISDDDIFSCTYEFSNGDCSYTAASCAAAAVAFCDCAGSSGHDTMLIPVCN